MPAASAKRSPCCRPPTLERDSFVFAKVHFRHKWGISVKFSQDRTYKTFGVVALADATAIYAGATATQFALATKRQDRAAILASCSAPPVARPSTTSDRGVRRWVGDSCSVIARGLESQCSTCPKARS